MPGYNCWGLPIDFLPKERSNEHLTFWIFLPSVIGAAIRRPQHAGHCKSNVVAGFSLCGLCPGSQGECFRWIFVYECRCSQFRRSEKSERMGSLDRREATSIS